MWNLNHDARTVAGLGVSAHSATVFEVLQNTQRVLDHAVAFDVVDVGEKADAASVVLVAGVVKAMGLRRAFGAKNVGWNWLIHGTSSWTPIADSGNRHIGQHHCPF